MGRWSSVVIFMLVFCTTAAAFEWEIEATGIEPARSDYRLVEIAGRPVIVYFDASPSIVYAVKTDSGWEEEIAVEVGPTENPDGQTLAVIELPGDLPAIFYNSVHVGEPTCRYAVRAESGWEITGVNDVDCFRHLFLTTDGKVLNVCNLNGWLQNGDVWEKVIDRVDITGGLLEGDMTSDGRIVGVGTFHSPSPSEWHVGITAGSQWVVYEWEIMNSYDGKATIKALDESRVGIVYSSTATDLTRHALKYVYQDGYDWKTETIEPWSEFTDSFDLWKSVLFPDGKIAVAYSYMDESEDGTYYLKYASRDPNGWVSETIVVSDVRIGCGTGNYPGDMVLVDGTPHLAYTSGGMLYTAYPVPVPPIHNITQDTYHETIQAAIDDANEFDTIVIPPDTYTGDGNRDIDFGGKAITVRSENPNDPDVVAATIIDCNGSAEDQHRGFFFHNSEGTRSVLSGLTVINGYGYGGGAIRCEWSSPTITKCVLASNSAEDGGALDNYASSPTVTDCTFTGNSAEYGGAVYNEQDSTPRLTNCIFADNTAISGGGIANYQSGPQLFSCVFRQNLASEDGGGMHSLYRLNARPKLINCNFTGNTATRGGAMYSIEIEPMATNCIFWGNSDSQIEGDARVTYCDVEDGFSGSGNIDADPCFADANNGDFHLKSQAGRWDPSNLSWVVDDVTSPCIDAGDPTSSIGWEPYPNGGIVNMGIYGGKKEGSKSYFGTPVCREPIAGDANGDCRIDFRDFMIMALHWCEDNNP